LLGLGDKTSDQWCLLGQFEEVVEKLRQQRTWVIGKKSHRTALIWQFAPLTRPFNELILPGTSQVGELLYWPSAYPLRAKFSQRSGPLEPWIGPIPGHDTIESFFNELAPIIAKQPWLEFFLCILHKVKPVMEKNQWYIQDQKGCVLPLNNEQWQLLALSGGHPVTLASEWDGYCLKPMLVSPDQSNCILLANKSTV